MKHLMKLISHCHHEWLSLRHIGHSQWDIEQRQQS